MRWTLPNQTRILVDFEGILFDSAKWYRINFLLRKMNLQSQNFPSDDTWNAAHTDTIMSGPAVKDCAQITEKKFSSLVKTLYSEGFRTSEPNRSFTANTESLDKFWKLADYKLKNDLQVLTTLPNEVFRLFQTTIFGRGAIKAPDSIQLMEDLFFENLTGSIQIPGLRPVMRITNSVNPSFDSSVYITGNPDRALVALKSSGNIFTSAPLVVLVDPDLESDDHHGINKFLLQNPDGDTRLTVIKSLNEITG